DLGHLGLGLPLEAGGLPFAGRLENLALALGLGKRLDPFALDLGGAENGRDQLLFAALDLGLLNGDFPLLLDLFDLGLFGDDALLLDVGLDLVRLVGLRLLDLHGRLIVGLLDLEVPESFGLFRLTRRLRDHLLLLGLRGGDAGIALGLGAADRDVTVGL